MRCTVLTKLRWRRVPPEEGIQGKISEAAEFKAKYLRKRESMAKYQEQVHVVPLFARCRAADVDSVVVRYAQFADIRIHCVTAKDEDNASPHWKDAKVHFNS